MILTPLQVWPESASASGAPLGPARTIYPRHSSPARQITPAEAAHLQIRPQVGSLRDVPPAHAPAGGQQRRAGQICGGAAALDGSSLAAGKDKDVEKRRQGAAGAGGAPPPGAGMWQVDLTLPKVRGQSAFQSQRMRPQLDGRLLS